MLELGQMSVVSYHYLPMFFFLSWNILNRIDSLWFDSNTSSRWVLAMHET